MGKLNSSNKANGDNETRGVLNDRLEEIRALEKKLINLKHKYISDTAYYGGGTGEERDATFLLIKIAGKVLALPLGYITEVVQLAAIAPLPERVRGVIGLVDYHGSALAVIDMADLMRAGPTRLSIDKLMVICSSDYVEFAVVVDEASDVITVDEKDVQVPEEVLPGALKALGFVKTPDGGALILDVMSIVFSIQPEITGADETLEDGDSDTAGGDG